MADRQISDLTAATQVTVDDLFVLEQNNTAKKLTGQILMNDLATALDGHGGIADIEYTAPVAPSLDGTLTITMADTTEYDVTVTNGNGITSITQYWAVSDVNDDAPAVWYTTLQTMTAEYRYLWSYTDITFDDENSISTTPQVIGVYGDKGDSWFVHLKYASAQPTQDSDMGDTPDEWVGIYSGTSSTAPVHYTSYTWYSWKGERGNTGNGIASVAKTGTSGVVDTYTVTFTDGNSTTFTVTNGSNISTISKTSTSGLTDTYTVTLTNGQTTQFSVNNGKSIVSITFTSNSGGGAQGTPGTYDTYTINYNDGDTSTFSVYNGANGAGAVGKVDGISPVGDDVPLLTIGNGAPSTATPGSPKSRYFDSTNSVLYICVGYDSGTQTYDWRGAGVTVDSAMSTSSTNPVQNKVISSKVGTAVLTTTAQNCSAAINEHDTEIGDVSSLTTTATTLAGAVNELDGDIGTLNTSVGAIETNIGTTALPTTAQTITGAIAELDGDISTLDTTVSGKVDKTGDTMTGNLAIVSDSSPRVTIKNTDMDSSAASLSANEYASVVFSDTNDRYVGYVEADQATDGTVNFTVGARTFYNGANVENNIKLTIDNAGKYSASFSHASAFRRALGLLYAVNDTATIGTDTNTKGINLVGVVTSSAKRVYITAYTPKSLEDIRTVTVTDMIGSVRGLSGYLDSMAYNTNLVTTYTVTAEKLTNNAVAITVEKSSAFTNVTNNTPVDFYGTVTLKFT